MPLDPAARVLRAKLAAYAMHAAHPIEATTRAGLTAAEARWINQVDPDRVLPEAERNRRARAARKSYFLSLAFRSAQVRKAGKENNEAATDLAAAVDPETLNAALALHGSALIGLGTRSAAVIPTAALEEDGCERTNPQS
jgi:hypothetical protein